MSTLEEDIVRCVFKLVPVISPKLSESTDCQESENNGTQQANEIPKEGAAVDEAADPMKPLSLPTVYLQDNQAVTLGRCRLTQIRDLKLSRRQVRVEAKASSGHVEVTQLGKLQNSRINGDSLVYPWSRIIYPGDSLCLAENCYEYKLERGENAETTVRCSIPSRKRPITETFDTDTATTTPASASSSRGRKSYKMVQGSPFTPQQLVDQLTFLSSGKKRRTSSVAEEKTAASGGES
ncbi:uncharacterized protein LOC129584770 [Paramacrobiotus metropolitanus]|uniref:uncharacterized protein LOC129584770 n=1 Tax=Paramacrobiotus metropolitanus TaxID=2943436 RepID=UPI0024457EE6|nr:uncharacterized protein LOC129584770 [Paramacrobiotus metropolitanus]